MDVNDPLWSEYETQLLALAEQATPWEADAKPVLGGMAAYLCLYGDNGLSPQEEMAQLTAFAQRVQQGLALQCFALDADYWQEVVLFHA
jgi:hypothetical protein